MSAPHPHRTQPLHTSLTFRPVSHLPSLRSCAPLRKQFTFYNNYINNCKPGNAEHNVVIYDAMVDCANMGDGCYGITFNTGCGSGVNGPSENCWNDAIPDPSREAENVLFCNTGQLQWAGNLNQNWVSAIKWTGRDVFNGNLPPDPDGPPHHRPHHRS
eukprot:CAMPEP_0185157568 /NCGR_PEP_ID=MMETSP1139-20130426/1847_1 /TAXON_ID=298111 /ORGANISM="Pavlova sp., Strain CCMP459" /LENGTH=157 /DNA_ID=CAMNT_0027722657 /DNA_START=44 /DNA_END=517 /DNA_ORIENTATION=-